MKTAWTAALVLACAVPAWAAGGHHAVDDAAILDEGQCELEGWLARARGGERLVHGGAGCRIGPVELGVAGEYARLAGASQTGWGLQAKWATELAEGWSAGLSVSPGWQARVRPRYQATTVAALLTWTPLETVALHVNLGRDLVHGGADQNRSGLAAEWTPRDGWTLLAERYAESAGHFVRAGVRWAATETFSVDLSRSHRLSGPGESAWTLGATWLLQR
jgi:hypothetical protein